VQPLSAARLDRLLLLQQLGGMQRVTGMSGTVSRNAACLTRFLLQKRHLRLCFIILGMGGITFSAAVLQSSDYLNKQYVG
jgi:hypothetical protein